MITRKLLSLIQAQKSKLPFYLYAYCLMPNHVHLLVERRNDAISRVMQRILNGFSQYFNRRYQKSGHLLQGRYKAILCQSDQYLSELVRYIHLNPVRARLVRRPEDYRYSSHRAYLGLDDHRLTDAEAVLRHFAARKSRAREHYQEFVRAGMKGGHREEFYKAEEGRLLGSEEFVEGTKRRVGDIPRGARPILGKRLGVGDQGDVRLVMADLIRAIERACGLERREFCARNRRAAVVEVKEVMVLIGTQNGLPQSELAEVIGLDSSSVSRRLQSAEGKMRESSEFRRLVRRVQRQMNGGG